MNAEQLHGMIHQLDAGLAAALRSQEREAEDELTRRRSSRLRQEGAAQVMGQLLKMAQAEEAARQPADGVTAGDPQEGQA